MFSAERIQLAVDRVTVYVSKSDRMMALSGWLFQSVRRLGQLSLPDLKALFHTKRSGVAGLDVIEADIRSDFKGHTYFRTHPAASSDLILLLRDNRSPGGANGRPLIEVDSELRYWVLKDNYPSG